MELRPIGLALDGHVIYGPFKNNGKFWNPCDVDVCNGRFFYDETKDAENTYYGYVATLFYPYILACFGPGSPNYGMQVGCSTNARYCESSANMPYFRLFGSLLLIALAIFA